MNDMTREWGEPTLVRLDDGLAHMVSEDRSGALRHRTWCGIAWYPQAVGRVSDGQSDCMLCLTREPPENLVRVTLPGGVTHLARMGRGRVQHRTRCGAKIGATFSLHTHLVDCKACLGGRHER